MTETNRRGRYAKTPRRLRDLREAALKLVQEKGHRNVTVAEIAKQADVSEPSVFYHFPTKESLLLSALQQFDDENIRSVGHEAGAVAGMGNRAEIGVRREHISRLYAEMAGAAVDREHPANTYFRERWARSFQVVATDIRRLQQANLVASDTDPDVAAQCILAAWEGLQFQWLHGPEFDIKSRLEFVIEAVLGPLALAEDPAMEREATATAPSPLSHESGHARVEPGVRRESAEAPASPTSHQRTPLRNP